jgi:hypothetical protein
VSGLMGSAGLLMGSSSTSTTPTPVRSHKPNDLFYRDGSLSRSLSFMQQRRPQTVTQQQQQQQQQQRKKKRFESISFLVLLFLPFWDEVRGGLMVSVCVCAETDHQPSLRDPGGSRANAQNRPRDF